MKKQIQKSIVDIKFLTILKKTWLEAYTFWRPIFLIVGVYGVLYALIILGLNVIPSAQDLSDQVSDYVDDSASGVVKSLVLISISVTSASQSDATTLLQFLLFIIASLALIWSLRKLRSLKKISISEAYYTGTSSIVPVVLVSIMLILCAIPAVIGSVIFSTAAQSAAGFELIVISVITGLSLLLSIYLFTMWWPAFYIASIPGTKPMFSMKKAASITKHHRTKLIINNLFFCIVLFIIFFLILIPIGIIIPVAVPVLAYILLFTYFALIHIYLFTTYRSLINEF